MCRQVLIMQSSPSLCAVMYVCNCSEVKGKLIIGCFPEIFSAVWLMLLWQTEVNSMSLNTWLNSNVLNFLNLSGKHFRRKKFSQEEIFATWCLIVKISKISASRTFLTVWYMGQFCIEITDYICCVFDHIVAFKALYCWTSVKGGVHTCFVDSLAIHTSMKHVWTLPLWNFSDTALWMQWCDRNAME